LQEFQAGTDPTNVGSIFRVITVEPAVGNGRIVIWNAQVNRMYRVEFRDEVTDDFWQELGIVPASGSTTSLKDPASTAHRIYRVVLQP
jgi:hypothetical protein